MASAKTRGEWLDLGAYFKLPESMTPMELVRGVVREPPAPRYGHQSLLTHLGALMDQHVREHRLGAVTVSPVDVVLDEAGPLVVQPDIVFVSRERLSIVRDRIFGPPDLVVEILSPRTARRDRTTKLGWYSRHGVAECWLVDVTRRTVEVVELRESVARRGVYSGDDVPRSTVLPAWPFSVSQIFD